MRRGRFDRLMTLRLRNCFRIGFRAMPLSGFAGAILILETPYKFHWCTSSMQHNRFPIVGDFARLDVQL